MTHRDRNIYLPGHLARCAPMQGCAQKHDCARYMALIEQGSPVSDFSLSGVGQNPWYGGLSGLCIEHIPLHQYKRQAPGRDTRVHKPVRGIL